MRYGQAALLIASAAALAGCAGGEASRPEAVIEVFSIPRNCVVEMNGEYIGPAPARISVPTTPEGRWMGSQATRYTIEVSTPNNSAVETKIYRGGDSIPRRLLFRPPYAHLYAGQAGR